MITSSLQLFSIESRNGLEVTLRHLAKGHIIGLQVIPDNTANTYAYQSCVSKLQIIRVVLKEKCVCVCLCVICFAFSVNEMAPPQSKQPMTIKELKIETTDEYHETKPDSGF